MNKTILAASVLAVAAAGSAQAQSFGDYMPWNWVRGDETYVSVKGGASMPSDLKAGGTNIDPEDGWQGNVAVGRYLNPNLRGEIEAGYGQNGIDNVTGAGAASGNGTGRLNVMTGMANMYYDFAPTCRLNPYVGAGIGAANIEGKDITGNGVALADDSDTVFAGQAMAGVSWAMTPRTALTAEYRYQQAAEADIGAAEDVNYRNHAVMAGLRFKF